MTTITADTRVPVQVPVQIRTSTPSEVVYESGSDEDAEELLRDAEAARASLEKFRREGRSAFVSHAEHMGTDEASV